MTTDGGAGEPRDTPSGAGAEAGGEAAMVLVTGTGLVALSAPTALQVVWLIAVCGVAVARALGRRGVGPTPSAGPGSGAGPGGPTGPTGPGGPREPPP